MTPEAKILVINATIVLIAYLGIYPSMPQKTGKAMARSDAVLTALSLLTAGALFAGKGVSFSLILFNTNWFVFSFLTFMLIETPFLIRFCRRHDIDLFGGDE